MSQKRRIDYRSTVNMFKHSQVILTLAITFIGHFAHADNWFHSCLKSADGTLISIDFVAVQQTANPIWGPGGRFAYSVWVNAKGGQAASASGAKITLRNLENRRPISSCVAFLTSPPTSSGVSQQTSFTGEITSPIRMTTDSGPNQTQQLEITVLHYRSTTDLVDPISNTTIFNIDLSKASATPCP